MVRRLLLAAVPCTVFALGLAACGGDDGNATTASASNSTTTAETKPAADTTTEPKLAAPASRYAPNLDDMGANASGNAAFLTDIQATFVLDADNYSKTKSFAGAADGKKLLTQWGYLGGYETGFIPEGRQTAVLNGAYYGVVEVHLFETADGAKKAYEHFVNTLKEAKQAQPVTATTVGNQSSTWTLTQGKVANSQVNMVHHRIVFRRGNLVAVVLTSGAEGFMKAEVVGALAAIIDQKALGTKPAVEPPPIAKQTPGATPTR